MEFLDRLEKNMRENGVFVSGKIDINKKRQRLRRSGHTHGKDIFIFIHNDLQGASYGDWRDESTWHTWWAQDWKKLTPAEKNERKKSLEIFALEQLKDKLNGHKEAKITFSTSKEADIDHPYLIKKQLWRALYAKQFEDKLIIPIYDKFAELQSIQYVYPNGNKHPEPGTSYKNGHLLLGEDISAIAYICEGWATGVTIYEATGMSVLIAFNASNILNVATWFKMKFPHVNYFICADNDKHLEKNIGYELAEEAAKIINATLLVPNFNHLIYEGKPTDFNDLMCIAGIEETENQLRKYS